MTLTMFSTRFKIVCVLAVVGLFAVLGLVLTSPSYAQSPDCYDGFIYAWHMLDDVLECLDGSVGGSVDELDDLDDVIIVSPSDGELLRYNGSHWIDATVLGGGNATVLNDLGDVIIASASSGQILVHDGVVWRNVNHVIYENNTASNLGTVGEGIFAQKSGVDLQFKKLLAGTGISLSANATRITITNTLPESTVCTNVGSGAGLCSGGNVNVDSLIATSPVTITDTTDDWTIACPTCVTTSDGWVLLANVTATNAATSLTTGAFTGYKWIHIDLAVQSQTSSSTWALRFNGDTGNNYNYRSSVNNAADSTGSSQSSASFIDAVNTNEWKYWTLDCTSFSARSKVCTGQSHDTGNDRQDYGINWVNTSAQITEVTALRIAGTGTSTTSTTLVVMGHN